MEDKMLVSKIEYASDGQDVPVRVKPVEKRKNDERQSDNFFGQDRFWAALAHAMGPMMVAAWVIGDGLSWMGPIFVTLGIMLYFSDKSPFVKFHARQAFALQLFGSFGTIMLAIALVVIGLPVWIILLVVSALLMLVLVGFILLPIVFLAYPAAWMATFLLPLSVLVFGSIGAMKVWNGNSSYRYPWLADWLDRRVGRTNGMIEYV